MSRILEANPLPDPKDIKDLNAYLSLWADERETTLEACVTNCQRSEEISKQIMDVLAEAKCDEDTAKIGWCVEYLAKIRTLARQKMNQITLYILENIEKYIMHTEEEKKAILGKSTALPNPQRPPTRRMRILSTRLRNFTSL